MIASAAGVPGLPRSPEHPGTPSADSPRAILPSVVAVCLPLVGSPVSPPAAGALRLLHPQKHHETLATIWEALSFSVNPQLVVDPGRVSQAVAVVKSFRGQRFVSLIQKLVLLVEQLQRRCLVSRHPVLGVHRHWYFSVCAYSLPCRQAKISSRSV